MCSARRPLAFVSVNGNPGEAHRAVGGSVRTAWLGPCLVCGPARRALLSCSDIPPIPECPLPWSIPREAAGTCHRLLELLSLDGRVDVGLVVSVGLWELPVTYYKHVSHFV